MTAADDAATIRHRAKADIDQLGDMAQSAERVRAEERERAASIACRRRYWPIGRLIARAIRESNQP